MPEAILQNGHSIIEKNGGEPRCIGWERAEWWIEKDTYSSCHEGLCLGLHVFGDCNISRQSNQLRYAHQYVPFGVTTRMLTRSPEF